MSNFTPEDMLRYLYNETTAEEAAALKLELETDWSLREKFEVLKNSVQSLGKFCFEPRQEAVMAILQYAGVESKAVELK